MCMHASCLHVTWRLCAILLEKSSRKDKDYSGLVLLESRIMKRKKLLVLLPLLVVAVIIVSSVAISGTTYTWEKTFEVTYPEIKCEIGISDCRTVGCPVKIWVMLKLGDDCGRRWHECREEWNGKCCENRECERDDWEHEIPDDNCCFQINGTYSVDLYWWNETQEDWQHLMYLQEEANITLTCWRHFETYTFTPTMDGEYKVIVTFTTETETLTFSSED